VICRQTKAVFPPLCIIHDYNTGDACQRKSSGQYKVNYFQSLVEGRWFNNFALQHWQYLKHFRFSASHDINSPALLLFISYPLQTPNSLENNFNVRLVNLVQIRSVNPVHISKQQLVAFV